MTELYVVGISKEATEKGIIWSIEGIYDDQKKAEEACLDYNYFVGPITINTFVGEEREWPNAYFPLKEGK